MGITTINSVTIGKNVSLIGQYGFMGCTSLKNLMIEDGTELLTFETFSDIIVPFKDSPIETMHLGRNITYNSKGLVDYYSPFEKKTSLTTLTIGNNVTFIPAHAFPGCTGLTSLVIPSSIMLLNIGSFVKCTGLTSLTLEDSTNPLDIHGYVTLSSLRTLYLGRNVDENLCQDNQNLTTLTIGDKVTEIPACAFSGCTGLQSLTIPSSVTSIGRSAFNHCSAITSLTIPQNVISIGENAFSDWANLSSLTFEDCDKPLNCSGSFKTSPIKTLYLGRDVEEFAKGSLESLTIGNKVTKINDYMFYGCDGLQTLTIPDGVTSIGEFAFGMCGFSSIDIGTGVSSIGEDAFTACSNLSKVNISDVSAWCNINFENVGANPCTFSQNLYLNNEEISELVIPEGVTKICKYAFYNCPFKTVTIPSSVNTIEYYAFANMSEMTDMYCYPETVPTTDTDAFSGAWVENDVLHVPSVSIDNYKSCSPWNEFGTIYVIGAENAITITAYNLSMEYGETVPVLTYKTEGGKLNGQPTLSCEATSKSPVGTYAITVSKGTVTNDNVIYVNGILTIVEASLNITAKSYTIKQGEALPEFEAEYSGFRNDETSDVLTKKPVMTTAATSASSPGTYDIEISGAEATNYDITYTKGKLTIVDADAVIVTANSYTRIYGEANPTFAYTSSGATLSGVPEITCEATATSPVGTYPIIIKKGSVTNYNDSYVNGTLTITKAPLTITAKNYTIKQGEALPDFEAEYSGFRNDETCDALTKKPVMTTTATSASSPGTYDIEISGAEATNYDITYTKGKLTIVDADAVIVTANSYTRIYGEANPTFAYTSSGATLSGVPEITCEATATSPVGTYPIIIKKGSVTNYNDSYVNGTLTIVKAPLNITAKNYTIKQGEALPDFEAEYSGFRNDETCDALTKKPVMTTAATSASSPGTYDIEISGAEATNYDITYTKGKLTIVDADAVIVTANSYSRIYGEANPTFAYTSSGATLSGVPEITCEATATSPVGTYPIIIKKGSVTNYNDSYINGTLTITKAPLTITAKSYTIRKGDDLPEMEIIYEGFKNNETEAVLSALPQVSCVATKDSAPGEYAITLSGAEAQNYEISLVAGKLTILAPPEPEPIIIEENGAIFSKNDDNTISIIGSEGIGEIYEIPAMVDCDGVECTVTVIGEFAFKDNSGLTQVTIPSTIEFIARGAFAGCINLATIYVYAIDPITIEGVGARTRSSDDNVFTGVNLETCILYVPKGCVEKYRVDKGWSIFKNILEIGGTGVNSVGEEDKSFDVFNIRGEKVRHAATSLEGLPKGIYIVNGKKIVK